MNSKTKHKLNNLLGIMQGNLELLHDDASLEIKQKSRVTKAITVLEQINQLLEQEPSKPPIDSACAPVRGEESERPSTVSVLCTCQG